MVYLVDYNIDVKPEDCTQAIWVGTGDNPNTIRFDTLMGELNDIFDLGTKVQYWHMENDFVDFRILSRQPERYGQYVSAFRFTDH